jgi:myo-inositol-1(or 4)-monophosphatase
LDLAYVAAGRYDGYWERELKSWDIAAGILLVREAGGMVAPVREGDDILEKGALIVANDPLFEPFKKIIRGA